jgi:hypothetical protein
MEKEPLEHAVRCWNAEETNADRITGRKTLIVGVPAGFLAVVGLNARHVTRLFAACLDPQQQPSGEQEIAIAGLACLALGLAGFFASICLAIGVRRRDPEQTGLASRYLHPRRGREIVDLAGATDDGARRVAFALALAAARTLHQLNAEVEERLYRAAGWLVFGVSLSFLALLTYAWVVN